MTHLTDDELGTLLAETFAAHEHLADDDTALRIARTTERGRSRRLAGLAAAAAVIVGVATAVALGGGNDGGSPAPLAPTPSVPAGPTLAQNRAEALRVSEQTLASVKVMEGAIRTGSTAALMPEPGLIGDRTLSRVASYAFGASPDTVEEFLLKNPPPGLKVLRIDSELLSMPHPTVGTAPGGVRYLTYTPRSGTPNTAYQGPNVLVEWKGLSGTTTVRFSTYLSARQPRAEESRLIVRDATLRARVTKTETTGQSAPRTQVADLDLVEQLQLIDALDSLVGSVERPEVSSCPPPLTRTTYTITVTGDRVPTMLYELSEPACGTQVVTVSRDGRPLAGTLDPWLLYEPLDQAFQRR